MKKNRTMRAATLLLALTLMTSCFVGGTFAKYVTTNTSNDTARVAKWGINAGTVVMDLFDMEYSTDVAAGDGDRDNLIAPGTTKSSQFAIINHISDTTAPEVDYNVTIDLKDTVIHEDIRKNTNIQWQLDDKGYGTWDKMMTDILQLSGDTTATYTTADGGAVTVTGEGATGLSITKKYQANTLAAEFADGKTHTIAWKWIFDKDAEVGAADLDATDTAMGNAAITGDLAATIKVTITATQVNE